MAIDNISKFYREVPDNSLRLAISKITQNPYAEKILERTPIEDMIYISREYNKKPDIYDDIFKGKIKFFAKGLQNNPMPVFNGECIKDLNEIIEPKSLTNTVANLFDIYGTKENPIQAILIGLKEKIIRTAFLDKKGNVVEAESLPIDNQDIETPLFKLIKASNNKIIRLTRD